jgi:hypothetical protein
LTNDRYLIASYFACAALSILAGIIVYLYLRRSFASVVDSAPSKHLPSVLKKLLPCGLIFPALLGFVSVSYQGCDRTTYKDISAAPRRIVLTGFMGSGKSTVGPLLAARLGWSFLDVDDAIEAEAGATIAELFARHGEAAFREREHAAIARLAPAMLWFWLWAAAPSSTPARARCCSPLPARSWFTWKWNWQPPSPDRNPRNALLPLRRAGLVHAGSLRIHGHRHRHIAHVELVDRLHAQVSNASRREPMNRLRHQVGRAAHRHQVDRAELADRLNRRRPALGLAHHPQQPVSASICRVNLSMRVAVVGPAGPTTSSRTGSTGPT